MKRIQTYSLLLLICLPFWALSQKNCNNPLSGFIPLPELHGITFRGYQGGLYAQGNAPTGGYLEDAIRAAEDIQPLDMNGNPSSDGAIIMAGVGASNPRTEFNAFMQQLSGAEGIQEKLKLVNTCIGGQGIQKMNQPGDPYWSQTSKLFDSLGFSMKQVQVIWVETDNTQNPDTSFPVAPLDLMFEMRTLLQTMKMKFPNAKLCYISARGYSGWVDQSGGATAGKGLLHPRDYYNGWAVKWLIEKADSGITGFRYKGQNAEIMMPLFASYHYSDGETPQQNGFFLECENDIGNDGLHLTPSGEAKIGAIMKEFFTTDSVASLWIKTKTAGLINAGTSQAVIYPNPSSSYLSWKVNCSFCNILNIKIINQSGRTVLDRSVEPGLHQINLEGISPGMYHVILYDGEQYHQSRFVKQE